MQAYIRSPITEACSPCGMHYTLVTQFDVVTRDIFACLSDIT